MLKIDDMIGDVLFIAFRDMGRMKEIGIDEQSGHFLLKGYDRIGIWLEHPGITIQHTEDVKGRPIPTNMQKRWIPLILYLKKLSLVLSN